MSFVIVDVGCIECGEETYIVGVYPSLAEAEAVARSYPRDDEPTRTFRGDGESYFSGGQHHVEIHEVTA
jgi:hypothetical protein